MPGRIAPFILLVTLGLAPGGHVAAQELAEPTLRGRALLGDSVLRSGMVTLHRVSELAQGEVDSARVAHDGSFTLRLPAVPDPERSDVYFASVRHDGVLYFGKAIALPVQLDSIYEIQAWDTILAPAGGAELAVRGRSIFLEEVEGGGWQATDLFEIANDGRGTLVARGEDAVWSHPLPEGARDVEVSQTDLVGGGAEVREGRIVVTAPIPPGQRLLVLRYTVADPFLAIPVPAPTERFEILVREPGPVLESPLLAPGEPAQLDDGAPFRRLTGAGLGGTVLRLSEGRAARLPPVRWMAVALALLLTGVGLWATRPGAVGTARRSGRAPTPDRRALVLEVARLDEDFANRGATSTPEERGAYEARRRELLRRLGAMG